MKQIEMEKEIFYKLLTNIIRYCLQINVIIINAMFTEERRVEILRIQTFVIIKGEIGIGSELRSEVVLEAKVTLIRFYGEVIVRMIRR